MKITLLRHGAPDFKAHWLMPTRGARRALDLYAASRVSQSLPPDARGYKSLATACVTSKLPRAVDSARIIGFTDSVASDLFNESELPFPSRLFVPVPWNLFLSVYRILWFFGLKLNCAGKSQDSSRARACGQYLIHMATKNESVVLVGHGIMNRLICSELQKSHWQLVERGGSGYWSFITLSCPLPVSAAISQLSE